VPRVCRFVEIDHGRLLVRGRFFSILSFVSVTNLPVMTTQERAQQLIVRAVKDEMARRSALAREFEALDGEVAECALRVFESPRAAANWLISENICPLGRQAPVKLAKTRSGRLRVLQVLGAIEDGGYL
jgi:uncharacterized protein (DUF2384 family)